MYNNTITLFNRYSSPSGVIWYPKVLKNVDLIVDKADINARYGTDTQDTAKLHIKYSGSAENIEISGYKYYPPKAWEKLVNEEMENAITFRSGQKFDFFMEGEFENIDPISDDNFRDGFYNHMEKNYDNVYVVSSASSPFSIIKHFEIMGK